MFALRIIPQIKMFAFRIIPQMKMFALRIIPQIKMFALRIIPQIKIIAHHLPFSFFTFQGRRTIFPQGGGKGGNKLLVRQF